MLSAAAQELRQQIAAVVAGTPSTTPGLPTGFAALDAVLPGGGIPAGRITELLAPPGLGKTTLGRSLAAATITAGRCVAWIDATRTLDPRDWVSASMDGDALWVVRPTDPARAPWCADLLLRTGAFALVVLDGAPVLPRVVAVRLAQLARDADAALLLLGDGTRASEIGGALRLVLRRNDRSPGVPGPRATGASPAPDARRVVVTIEKGGPYHHVQLEVPGGNSSNPVARRLCAHPEIPDRRGVARSRRHHGAAGNTTGNAAGNAAGNGPRGGAPRANAPRARRFAQPEYPARR
jgi:recombination protein RecA